MSSHCLRFLCSVLTSIWSGRGSRRQTQHSSRDSFMTSGSACITETGTEGEFQNNSRGSHYSRGRQTSFSVKLLFPRSRNYFNLKEKNRVDGSNLMFACYIEFIFKIACVIIRMSVIASCFLKESQGLCQPLCVFSHYLSGNANTPDKRQ